MSRHLTRVHLAAAILLLALATSAAASPNVDSYRFRERAANAGFYFSDSSGCIQTSMDMSVVEDAQRDEPGRQDRVAWGIVSIHRYDNCQYRTLLSVFGFRELQPGELVFGGNLATAVLDATFDLFDFETGNQRAITIDLTWTAKGPITQIQERFSVYGPGFRYTGRSHGSSRPAEAAGSVQVDSEEILSGRLSDFGSLSHLRSGSMSISRN